MKFIPILVGVVVILHSSIQMKVIIPYMLAIIQRVLLALRMV